MNRIYRLVWNRTLRVLQVASELTASRAGAGPALRSCSPLRRHPLALACCTALGLATVTAPVWSATSCTVNGVTYANCVVGTAGGNGGDGTASAGGTGGIGSRHGATDGSANDGGAGAIGDAAHSGQGAANSGGGADTSSGGVLSGGSGGSGGGGGGRGGAGSGVLLSFGGSAIKWAGGGGAGGGGGFANKGTGGGGAGGGGVKVTNIDHDVVFVGGGGGGGGGGGAARAYVAKVAIVNHNVLLGGEGGDGGKVYTYGGYYPFITGGGGGGGGGAGLWLGAGGDITNAEDGMIVGGNGGAGNRGIWGNNVGAYGGGGGGGAGLILAGGGKLANRGVIQGGHGGASGDHPGNGGVGVYSTGDVVIITQGIIAGGLSGDGKTRADAVKLSGGGNILTLEAGYSFTGKVVSTSVVGQNGASQGDALVLGGNSTTDHGTGPGTFDLSRIGSQFTGFATYEKTGTSTWTLTGSGQESWSLLAGTLNVGSNGTTGILTGSQGADGGAGVNNNGGDGTDGNVAINAATGVSATVAVGSAVYGGDGGDGNNGGNGGAGIRGSGFTLTNAGQITGGLGGGGSLGAGGAGGAGVSSTGDASVTTSGSIAGGKADTGTGAQADAVNFSGGGNTLTLEAGYRFAGNVVSTSVVGTNGVTRGDTLALGGDTSPTSAFDVVNIVAKLPTNPTANTTYYVGFDQLEKTGTSTWTLSGSTKTAMPWAIKGGTLNVSTDGSLGTGTVTMGAGTTLGFTTSGLTLDNDFSLSGDPNFAIKTGQTETISGVIADGATPSAVEKDGAGTLVLTGTNTYTGGTTIADGTLQIGNGGTTGSIVGNATDNGMLVFNRSDRLVYSGAISGSGSLMQNGTGVITLAGTNTYTGGTTISAGTLRLGDGGTVGSIVGNIVDDASLVFDRSDNVGFAGVISGSGTLTQTGPGRLTLTGANTFSGGTLINAGTVAVGNDDALGGGTVTMAPGTTLAFAAKGINLSVANAFTLSGNSTFVVNANQTGTLGGVIADSGVPGTLEKAGTGTLILTGANTWSGGTRISAGTLQIGDGGSKGSIAGDVTDNGTLAFGRKDNVGFAGVVSGSGALVQAGAGTLTLTGANTYTGGTTVAAGTLAGNTKSLQGAITDNAALVFSQADDGIFDGTLSGTGTLTKTGAGELIINSSNPTFTGNTMVKAGSLIVGDDGFPDVTLGGAVMVAKGALLGGFGTVGELDLAGTLAPGHSLGALHVAGDATFQPGSTWQVEVDPDGSSDHLDVSGKAILQGGDVTMLIPAGTVPLGTDYTILQAQGGIQGQFDSVDTKFKLTFLKPVLAYLTHTVTLSLERNDTSFASVARTRNQKNTAGGIESLGWGNPVYDTIATMDANQARDAFDQLSGEWYANALTARLHDSRYVREAMNQRLTQAEAGRAEANAARLGHTAGTVWFHAWGQWGDHDGDGNAARMRFHGSGLLVGVDADLDRVRIGGVLGASRISIRDDQRASDGHDKATWLGVYGSAATGPMQWRAGVAYARDRIDSNRRIALAGLADSVGADPDGHTEQAWIEAALPFASTHGHAAPFLNLAHVRVSTDGWREGSSSVALQGRDSQAKATLATLGIRSVWTLADTEHPIRFHGRIGWRQAFGADTPQVTLRLDGSAPFAVYGLPLAQHAIVMQAGLDFAVSRNVRFDVGYSGQFASHMLDQGGRMSLKIGF